jgi:hypothetical protein
MPMKKFDDADQVSLVRMPIVRLPCGLMDRASLRETELVRSTFAGELRGMRLTEIEGPRS